jgi:hypothetical protein
VPASIAAAVASCNNQLVLLLQARYILVKGGTLQVGSEERPFTGAACITLHGGPDSRKIPLYGGKVSYRAALYT